MANQTDPNKMPCRISDDPSYDYSDWLNKTGFYEEYEPDEDAQYETWRQEQVDAPVNELAPLIDDDPYPRKRLDEKNPPSALFYTVALASKVYIDSLNKDEK